MKKKKMYVCQECSHRLGTVGGIRGHIWAKHRNRGKSKRPIRKGVDFITEEQGVEDEKLEGLDWVGSEALGRIVEGDIGDDGKLGDTGRIALEELRKRDPAYRAEQ